MLPVPLTSVLRGYDPERGFILDIQTELHSGQRRESVRIVPPEEDLLYLAVRTPESDDIPLPCLVAAEDEGSRAIGQEITLENISAGGVRLGIVYGPNTPAEQFAYDSRLLCFLRLKGTESRPEPPADISTTDVLAAPEDSESDTPQGEDVLTLWLVCSVRYCSKPDASGTVFLGLACTAWAVPDENGTLVWSAVGRTGQIPLLFEWVWARVLRSSAERYWQRSGKH